MSDVDTKLLRSFLAVASERSVSVAAELCGISQGTMSLRIQCLENRLGMRLFERRYRDIRLTMEGRDLLTEARAFVDMHDRLVDRASEKQLTGSVWLGIAEGCFVDLIRELLERVQRVYTALELNILCENNSLLQRKIEEGVLDLAVVMSLEKLPSAMQLSRPRLQWVASPDFAIHDWRVLPLACYPDDRLLGAAAKHALRSRSVAYREAICSANERVILSAVSSGTAVTVMAEGSIPEGLQVVSAAQALPPLGRARIQLLQQSAPQSEAARAVKRQIAGLYPGS